MANGCGWGGQGQEGDKKGRGICVFVRALATLARCSSLPHRQNWHETKKNARSGGKYVNGILIMAFEGAAFETGVKT